jgi:small subunit ribosomal protein S9
MTESNAFIATGRRKTSVARVRLQAGAGKFTINGRELDAYLTTEELRSQATEPLRLVNKHKELDTEVLVTGGGSTGQAGAIRQAISRALLKVDAALRGTLKPQGMLTRDPRMKERKKPGQPGARRRFQFSKR